MLDGLYHRTLHLSSYWYSRTFIEGIGDIDNGLFGPYVFEFEGFDWMLNAFVLKDSDVYSFGPCDSEYAVFVENKDQHTVRIYPNPASNQFTIESTSPFVNALLKIYDSSGKVVLQKMIAGGSPEINTEKLPDGIYAICILQDGHKVNSGIFIKE